MSNKLQIQRLIPEGDAHTRVYFSHTELTKRSISALRGECVECDPILATVLEIPGIVVACFTPYSLAVIKTPTYEWAEIENTLLRLLTSFNLGEGVLESKPEEDDTS